MALEVIDSLKSGMLMMKRKDDDMFDRLSNRYTMGFLLASLLFLGTKTYVGDPIDCWVPQEFQHENDNENWVRYADNYCWIKNTYHVPTNVHLTIPQDLSSPDQSSAPEREIKYYQWVPFILVAMMLTFAIPACFWRFAMSTSGYDVEAVIRVVSSRDSINPQKRDETIRYVVAQMDRHISSQRRLSDSGCLRLGNRFGRYLYIMYVITKLLYVGVAVGLFFLMTIMMGGEYKDFGLKAMKNFYHNGESNHQNLMFPRVTFCDFAIRAMGGNIRRYTMQCVLPVNLFNERIFFLIWWWLVILAALSTLGLLISLIRTLRPGGDVNFITKHLLSMDHVSTNSDADQQLIKHFTGQYLRLDGVFCMRLIAQNTTDVIAAEIVAELYRCWREAYAQKNRFTGSKTYISGENI